jgi:hypothetical protein
MIMIEKGSKYRHFKGNEYVILGIAIHTETGEELVIYQSIKEPEKVWARPKKMFLDYVDREEYTGPRFERLDKDD